MALALPTVPPMRAFHLEVGDRKKASDESSRGTRSFRRQLQKWSPGNGIPSQHWPCGPWPACQGGAVGLSELSSSEVWAMHLAVEAQT